MSLALRLGRTLEELGQTMSSAEFSLWVEFYREHPWDGEWMQTGIVAAAIGNFAGKIRKENSTPLLPSDFMPPWDKNTVIEEPDPFEHFGQYAKSPGGVLVPKRD